MAALRWVRANIAAFGGDPSGVVIGGQSAGAVSVNDLIMSPLAEGLFRSAVAKSGSDNGIATHPLAVAEQLGVNVQGQRSTASLAQLRALPAPDLLKAAGKASEPKGAKFAMVDLPLAPNVDGYAVPFGASDSAAPLASPVPLLTGFNSDEYGLFCAPVNKAEFEEMVRERYSAFADRFLALYPHGTNAEAVASTSQVGHDRAFNTFIICSTLDEHLTTPAALAPTRDAGIIDQATYDGWVGAVNNMYSAKPVMQRNEAIRSASLAAMTLMLAAQDKGLVSCPIVGFDPAGVAEAFGLADTDVPVMLVTVGYTGPSTWPKSRARR